MNTRGPRSQNALWVGGNALMYLYIISTVKEILHSYVGPPGLVPARQRLRCYGTYEYILRKKAKNKICYKKFIMYKTETTQRAQLSSHSLQKQVHRQASPSILRGNWCAI